MARLTAKAELAGFFDIGIRPAGRHAAGVADTPACAKIPKLADDA
jgi:hypothetical protein